ncbi:hypothetical protein CON53_20360 [Bacillus cereus]|nr:hypothetical protein CON53_20360 [Bacillus cereus]PFH91305.1 hypothetical protein COI81_07830 [Bacillus cereus]PFM50153.1 hypothetical protein COJ52_27485 [Bacillus cereus]PFS11188.1 hypothetical protein COK55_23270 [Bacillus cereus]PGS21862.1 hypothetical protein COC55_23550 [Bacillus cereus]
MHKNNECLIRHSLFFIHIEYVSSYSNLFVLFDGEIEPYNCHPYWEIAYYDDEGKVVHSCQKGKYAI